MDQLRRGVGGLSQARHVLGSICCRASCGRSPCTQISPLLKESFGADPVRGPLESPGGPTVCSADWFWDASQEGLVCSPWLFSLPLCPSPVSSLCDPLPSVPRWAQGELSGHRPPTSESLFGTLWVALHQKQKLCHSRPPSSSSRSQAYPATPPWSPSPFLLPCSPTPTGLCWLQGLGLGDGLTVLVIEAGELGGREAWQAGGSWHGGGRGR